MKHWKQSSGIYHLRWVGMRGVYVQVCVFVALEVVADPGRSQQRVIALLCAGLQLCDCERSNSEFCVNVSVAAAADKQRNVAVVCIYIFFIRVCVVGVCFSLPQ